MHDFDLSAIVNNATMNRCANTTLRSWFPFFCLFPRVGLLDHAVILFLIFEELWKGAKLLARWLLCTGGLVRWTVWPEPGWETIMKGQWTERPSQGLGSFLCEMRSPWRVESSTVTFSKACSCFSCRRAETAREQTWDESLRARCGAVQVLGFRDC